MTEPDDKVVVKCIGREEQKLFLVNSFGKSDSRVLPSALFLWGEGSSGKLSVVEEALAESAITNKAIINSHEFILGTKILFPSILKQLAGDEYDYKDKEACDSVLKFINGLNVLINGLELGRVVIVIKNVEFLRKDFQDLLILFTTLKDQIQQNICTVLCSSLPISSYYSIIHKKIIPTLYFPQYTKDQIYKILCQTSMIEKPTDEENEAYEAYVQILLNVFYYFTRNLRVLQKLAEHHWPDFKDEKSNRSNILKWKKIEPKIMQTFNLMNFKILPINDTNTAVESGGKTEEENNEIDLPLYTKYLLISAYIAAQNPVSSDKRFFMQGKEVGGRKRKADEFKENKLRGPQVFSQIRFMAILSKILGDRVDATEMDSNFKVHVTSLVHLGLLQFQSTGDKSLDQCKFRCLVDFPFIEKISKSIDFEIKRYLYSFVNTHQ